MFQLIKRLLAPSPVPLTRPVNPDNPDCLDYPDITEHPHRGPLNHPCRDCGHPEWSIVHSKGLPKGFSPWPFQNGDILSEW